MTLRGKKVTGSGSKQASEKMPPIMVAAAGRGNDRGVVSKELPGSRDVALPGVRAQKEGYCLPHWNTSPQPLHITEKESPSVLTS